MVEIVEQKKGESEEDFFDRLARVIEEIHALKHVQSSEGSTHE